MAMTERDLLERGYVIVGNRAVKREPAPATPTPAEPARNKYGAVRTEGDGPNGTRRTYDSKAESRFAATLNARQSVGEIVSWLPQPSLETGTAEDGKPVRYRADALVILETFDDGSFRGRFVDVKGRDTPASRAKRAALRRHHSIDVEVVT